LKNKKRQQRQRGQLGVSRALASLWAVVAQGMAGPVLLHAHCSI
jgi:hypothetical protein